MPIILNVVLPGIVCWSASHGIFGWDAEEQLIVCAGHLADVLSHKVFIIRTTRTDGSLYG